MRWVADDAGNITKFLYDGNALVLEYDSSGTVLRRYVHGNDVEADDPLIWYEGSQMVGSQRRYVHADPRGSIVAVTSQNGQPLYTNSYDEFGIPDTATGDDISTKGRFRYTGQAWIPEIGMYYYKARIYSPTLGRFLQTDPIGYEGGINIYAYATNDPINLNDPSGLCPVCWGVVIEGIAQALNSDDRQAWADSWDAVKKGEFGEAFDAVDTQLGRIAISGATGGIGGRVASSAIKNTPHAVAVVSGSNGLLAAGQTATGNLMEGRAIGEGVLQNGLIGAASGGLATKIGLARADLAPRPANVKALADSEATRIGRNIGISAPAAVAIGNEARNEPTKNEIVVTAKRPGWFRRNVLNPLGRLF